MEPHENNTRQIPEDVKNPEYQQTANPLPSKEVNHCAEEQRSRVTEVLSDKERRQECFMLCSELFRDFAIALGDEIDILQKQRDDAMDASKKALEASCLKNFACSMIEKKMNNARLIFRFISRISGKHVLLAQEMKTLKRSAMEYEVSFKNNEKDIANIRAGIKALRKEQHRWFQLANSMNHNGVPVNNISIDEVISYFNKLQHAISISRVRPDFKKNHEELIITIMEDLGALIEPNGK